jgi:predicted RND superfamily exporter protein
MGFTSWFKRNTTIIMYVSATSGFMLSFAKEYVEDARRTVEKIESVNLVSEHTSKVKESEDLREEFESKIGRPSVTAAEMITRLGMTNRNDQLAWSELSTLHEESTVIGRELDSARIDDLFVACNNAQADYEEILRQFHGDTSKFPDDPAVVNRIKQLVLKFKKESETMAVELPKIFVDVQAHMQEAHDEANEKLLLWRYGGRFLLVLSFIVNLAAIAAGAKPAEGAE